MTTLRKSDAQKRWRRGPTYADGSWRIGRGWTRIGLHVAYYLNMSNLPGMRFYTVQCWFPFLDVTMHYNGMEQDPDGFHRYIDKESGTIKDARIEDPEHAAHMDKYRHEGRFEWSVMGRFPWKYQMLNGHPHLEGGPMTRVDISPEQRQAEAAAPRRPVARNSKVVELVPCPKVLNDGRRCDLLTVPGAFHPHRMTAQDLLDLYQDETLIFDGGMAPGLTASMPPVTHNFIEHTKRDGGIWYEDKLEEEPADRNGQNLSAAMIGLIGGIKVRDAFYLKHTPVRKAMQEWERSCRRRHHPGVSGTGQWRDHLQGPLCSDLLRAASIGVSLQWCANFYGIAYPRAERLRDAGLRFVAERMQRWQDDQLGIVHDRESCEQCREEGA